jgi:hypothetical protein
MNETLGLLQTVELGTEWEVGIKIDNGTNTRVYLNKEQVTCPPSAQTACRIEKQNTT